MDADVVRLQSCSVNVVLGKSKQYLYSKHGAANVSTEGPFSIRCFKNLLKKKKLELMSGIKVGYTLNRCQRAKLS